MCIVFSWTKPVCLCFQIPSALSAHPASWTSAAQALRSNAPSSLQSLRTQLSPLCFGILLRLMICISVYGDSYRCVLRPWPSMDTSETFAHIYNQNGGVYSALIKTFLFIVDGQNLLVFDVCLYFYFQWEVPERKNGQDYPCNCECGSIVLKSVYLPRYALS